MFIPVVGPYVALKRGQIAGGLIVGRVVGSTTPCPQGGQRLCLAAWGEISLVIFEYGVLVFDPIVQATGLTMTVIGATDTSHGRASAVVTPSHPHVSLAPTWQQGPGIPLTISSW